MELKTERLYIRNLHPSDWKQMARIFADFERSEYAAFDAPLPEREEEVKALTEHFAGTNLFFAAFLPENGDMIGYVCFHEDHGRYDLGYCFHSSVHRRGYAYEAVSALLAYMEKGFHVHAFTAGTALANTPSCALLKKLGFHCGSTETLAFRRDDAGNEIAFVGGNFVRE